MRKIIAIISIIGNLHVNTEEIDLLGRWEATVLFIINIDDNEK